MAPGPHIRSPTQVFLKNGLFLVIGPPSPPLGIFLGEKVLGSAEKCRGCMYKMLGMHGMKLGGQGGWQHDF